MELILTCPVTLKTYPSAFYRIVEHGPIETSADGRKIWPASIEMLETCPCCGGWHTYDVNTLACPFNP